MISFILLYGIIPFRSKLMSETSYWVPHNFFNAKKRWWILIELSVNSATGEIIKFLIDYRLIYSNCWFLKIWNSIELIRWFTLRYKNLLDDVDRLKSKSEKMNWITLTTIDWLSVNLHWMIDFRWFCWLSPTSIEIVDIWPYFHQQFTILYANCIDQLILFTSIQYNRNASP